MKRRSAHKDWHLLALMLCVDGLLLLQCYAYASSLSDSRLLQKEPCHSQPRQMVNLVGAREVRQFRIELYRVSFEAKSPPHTRSPQ